MYWYYGLILAAVWLLAGVSGFAGANWILPKKFRARGWTAFCRREYSIHCAVIGLVNGVMSFCCWYFSFTLFETLLWLGLLLIPTVSDFRMLGKKYRALL